MATQSRWRRYMRGWICIRTTDEERFIRQARGVREQRRAAGAACVGWVAASTGNESDQLRAAHARHVRPGVSDVDARDHSGAVDHRLELSEQRSPAAWTVGVCVWMSAPDPVLRL